LLAKAKDIYAQAGRSEEGELLLKDATAEVRSLNNEAVMLAQKGNYAAAIERLRQAHAEAPHNPRILMNAVWIMLKNIEKEGMDHELLEEATEFLEEAERQAPGHGRLATLRAQMKDVEARFGIRRK